MNGYTAIERTIADGYLTIERLCRTRPNPGTVTIDQHSRQTVHQELLLLSVLLELTVEFLLASP